MKKKKDEAIQKPSNGKQKEFLRRIVYSLSANCISLLVSFISTLIIPKLFGGNVEKYGYYQLYLFYAGYIGLFHFGWVDGVLLRTGGKKYDELDKDAHAVQFRLFCVFELLITILITVALIMLGIPIEKEIVLLFAAVNIAIVMPRSYLQYLLQATNRIKEYSLSVTICRLSYLIFLIALVCFNNRDYKVFIILDITSKLISLLVTMFLCKDIALPRKTNTTFAEVKSESLCNLRAGFPLVLANIASILITGIVRMGIEWKWDVQTFGKISLTLNISSMLITFISAISVVLFPTLRNVKREKMKEYYGKIETGLMLVAFVGLIFYYPIESLLIKWLPHYAQSLELMAILFPMCIFEAKMALLVKTYIQVLRYEKSLLYINVFGVLFSLITTLISIGLLESITLSVVSILLNVALRCILAECYLAKKEGLKVVRSILTESGMVIIFIISNTLVKGWIGTSIYILFFMLFVLFKKKATLELCSIAAKLYGSEKGN